MLFPPYCILSAFLIFIFSLDYQPLTGFLDFCLPPSGYHPLCKTATTIRHIAL
jgi:hypothetical protein